MNNNYNNSSKDDNKRKTFKIIGVTLISLGGLCAFIGFVDFFTCFNSFRTPSKFYLIFVGFFLVTIASVFLSKAKNNYNFNDTIIMYDKTQNESQFQKSTCRICGSTNDITSKFCNNCGNKLEVYCENCGSKNNSSAKFCNNCGKKLK